MKHEDNRRILIEWIKDYPVKSCKVLIAKDNCDVGGHYHKLKTEIFYLLKGEGFAKLDDNSFPIKEGDTLEVSPLVRHSFSLKEGSILLGASTEPFNPDDEYTA